MNYSRFSGGTSFQHFPHFQKKCLQPLLKELFEIDKIMGTPNEDSWPGMTSLPDFKSAFPKWTSKDLKIVVPNLDSAGLNLLCVSSYYTITVVSFKYKLMSQIAVCLCTREGYFQ